jgi:hypothetical protein
VKISSPSTWATARAWEERWPRTISVMSMSTTDGGRAYERYWALAHTNGRPVVRSSASMAAPRPQPPNRVPRPEHSAGTTGICQEQGSSVRASPKNRSASTPQI